VTYCWKDLDKDYNFVSNLISIEGLQTKLWGPKVTGVPTLTISGLPLGSPETKSHLDVDLMERHRVYYKGEGGGFPQVRAMMSLVSPNCSWLILVPKVFQLCINHLVLVLCRSVWVVDAYHCLVPSWSSSTPLYLSKCCKPGSVPQLLAFPLFFVWTHIWVHTGAWGCVSFSFN